MGRFDVTFSQTDRKENILYNLFMFPYPSGAGLHIGHCSNFTINDVFGRYWRMKGKKVIMPIGWDAFGLPTENYAMKQGRKADVVTQENVDNFIKQSEMMNRSIDWTREINTSKPEYYKWTQWIFKKLFEKGLVYKKDALVNWCPTCQTVLANDQVVDGKCERCDTEIIQKKHPQWFIQVTKYADRLIDDLSLVDWPEETKKKQIDWIGRSSGAEVRFPIVGSDTECITIFTTRADTIYGVTALVVAPELTSWDALIPETHRDAVLEYRHITAKQTAVQRQQHADEKTGVFSGLYVKNPLSGHVVPVWFADYVLPDYATGCVMFVPAHDERDRAFAQKNSLPICEVIQSPEGHKGVYTGQGILINSGEFDGLDNMIAKEKIIEKIHSEGVGTKKTTYKLRDWSVSRQRYWGSPIPVYYDENNHPHLIPDEELPVVLPLDVENYKPSGVSPLETHETFKHYHKDGKTYRRECDTLDTFVCSSFYFLRYLDNHNDVELAAKWIVDLAMPVDLYVGGKEHTVGHLIYSRFIHKFLFDLGYVSCPEPFHKLVHQGMVLAADGRKMSKRRGNIINPDDVVAQHGSDAVRMYLLFMGPVEDNKARNDSALASIAKFIKKIENFVKTTTIDVHHSDDKELVVALHKTIQKVGDDISILKFNTAIAQIMILVNQFITKRDRISLTTIESLILVLAPFCPMLADDLWAFIGKTDDVAYHVWPTYNPELLVSDFVEIGVQIGGKTKGSIIIPKDASEADVRSLVEKDEKLSKYMEGVKKFIYVPGRIVNIIL